MKLRKVIFLIVHFFISNVWAENLFTPTENNKKYNINFYDSEFNQYDFEQFAGNILVVHFWATWCSPCKEEMIQLNAFQKQNRDKPIIVIPVSEDFKGFDVVKKYYQQNKLNDLLSFMDKKNEVFSEMSVVGLPTTVIINTRGEEVSRATGPINWKNEDIVNYLMKFYLPKPKVNEDYKKFRKIQGMDEVKVNKPLKKEIKSDIMPKDAVTNLEPMNLNMMTPKEQASEITVSNPSYNQFSLKVRRPVNKKQKE